jgi:hypothetical protein
MSDAKGGPNFSPGEERALSSLLDEIIPPSRDGKLPGAGQLGLAGVLAERAPDLVPGIAQGLAALDALAGDRGATDFAALSPEDRVAVLNEHATREPGFLPGLIFHTYVGYYEDGRVMEALGLEARPPHPLGYAVEPMDPALVDRVRRRPKMYR